MSSKKRLFMMTGYLALVVCAVPMTARAARMVNDPVCREDNRPVMQMFAKAYQPGDVIMMNNSMQYAFFFYIRSLGAEGRVPLELLSEKFGADGDTRLTEMELWMIDDVADEDGGRPCAGVYRSLRLYSSGKFTGKALAIRYYDTHYARVCGAGDLRIPGAPRVWLLLSHYDPALEPLFTGILGRDHPPLLRVKGHNAAGYLFLNSEK